jgi:hypothetical protein
MERDDIEAAIRSAFAGVRLGSGISLREAAVIDNYGRGYTEAEFRALPQSEVTDDWTRIPDEELIREAMVPHLDADGLRYYLPALMLWLLAHYDEDRIQTGADMTAIHTMGALAPYAEFAASTWPRYDTSFSLEQRTAIASFVEALPRLVHLDQEDATRVSRSLDHYWRQFLPRSQ